MNVKMCVPMLDAILNRPSRPRREKQLGFESPESDSEPEKTSVDLEKRRKMLKMHLPPVTATRLNSPAKSLRKNPPGAPKLDRANTVAF